MGYLKAFVSGFLLPGIGLPFLIMFLLYFNALNVLYYYPSHFIPIAWGLWNVIYFAIGKGYPIRNQRLRLFVHGALLGLLTSSGLVWFYRIHEYTGHQSFLEPFVIAPALYGLFWCYAVKIVNKSFGLKD